MNTHEEELLQEAGEETLLPASFSQQRLWFIDRFLPGQAIYNIPCALLLTGQLRPDVLEQSLAEVISRHEVLRTTFEEIDGELTQVIVPDRSFTLPLTDLTHLPLTSGRCWPTASSKATPACPSIWKKGPCCAPG
ncbi:hypothetical protein CBW65_20305 [Tumebacillus avium]|uniref:Condensation domain-containing protein n=1 Tax=Tumebacillus avium TaxID=1903704 RepID=A0A1Y0IU84_9BACL|nr:condensation domain-containing protein [Tumebacillus avium]ARU63055.1 hypothetical protein CBW65_20305 [Tumebacillus avium]